MPPKCTMRRCWWCFINVIIVYSVQALSRHLIVLGVGQVGQAVLHATRSTFDTRYGIVRTDEQLVSDDSNLLGVHFLYWESNMNAIIAKAKVCTHVLVTLPPDAQSMNCAAIAENLPESTWVGVLSTTGVYGNHHGQWVTETSECRGRKNYLEHENVWLERGQNCRLNIFRCAGIYGPQASALHTVFRDGINNKKEDSEQHQGFPTSRIHMDDIVSAICASMDRVDTSDTATCCHYNLADDEPATRSTVLLHAAQLLESIGVVLPDHKDQPNTAIRAQRRKTDNKRVCNRLLKEKLLSTLKYPTYREGLSAILDDKSCPWWH